MMRTVLVGQVGVDFVLIWPEVAVDIAQAAIKKVAN
jgi:hypothetical protein